MNHDGLSKEQLEILYEELLRVQAELRSGLDLSSDSARTVELNSAIGRLTRVDAIQQQKLAQANRGRYQYRLRQVQAALTRLTTTNGDEEYGDCMSCGETIAFKRLKARPESTLCIDCQSDEEGNQERRNRR